LRGWAALFLALASSVMVTKELLDGRAPASSDGATWFLAGSQSE
jgi:hypothetical protein